MKYNDLLLQVQLHSKITLNKDVTAKEANNIAENLLEVWLSELADNPTLFMSVASETLKAKAA